MRSPGGTSEILRNVVAERAKADQIALGTPGAYRARLADLVGL
ncbi:hypothetical protein [Actinomadura geliboluensis]